MIEVINLAMPFFALIFLGYACGKLKRLPDSGLVWMNFFLIYVALPAMFFRILAKTPVEQINNGPFVAATTLATGTIFALSYGIGLIIRHGDRAEATIAAAAGAYGNIGYMGPGLALATLGADATVPVALIFFFDNFLLFSLVPLCMALSSKQRGSIIAMAGVVGKQIALSPFILATFGGALSAAIHFEPPILIDRVLQFLQNAAAPCALFTLGVTVALRPVDRVSWDVPLLVGMKLIVHPVLVLLLLSMFGHFQQDWVYTAVLMAALPPALNVFVMARQYDTWVRQASGSVLIGTVVSVITLTSILWMVKMQVLPYDLFR